PPHLYHVPRPQPPLNARHTSAPQSILEVNQRASMRTSPRQPSHPSAPAAGLAKQARAQPATHSSTAPLQSSKMRMRMPLRCWVSGQHDCVGDGFLRFIFCMHS
ncbi:hypothetical protein DUNSADRAFT_9787, partial [Dunaliella salina]